MSPIKLNEDEFQCLKNYIEQNCGIILADNKSYLVEGRLSPLLTELKCNNYKELCWKVTTDTTRTLREKIIDAITTNETLWFRDVVPFSTLEQELLPKWFSEIKNETRKTIRIWCAACSTGQEPYSVAITFREYARKNGIALPNCIEILGTDISSTVLFIASSGRYDQIAISRGLPEYIKNYYFRKIDNTWKIQESIKKMVTFKQLNLQNPFTSLGAFDLIFCRYVAIYFSEKLKRDLFTRLTRSLNPKGYLFIGASELLSLFNNSYTMIQSGQHVYYQIKEKTS